MPEMPHPPAESSPGDPVIDQPRRARWQVGIRTLVLLTAAIAVWMTVVINRRHNAMLESRIKAMRHLAHELLVEDARKIAVVKLEELWMDDNKWDIHLPAGQYRLCLATREIDRNGFAPVVKSAPLDAGRHRIVLEQRRDGEVHRISVTRDGRPLVTAEEPKEWNPGVGSEGGGEFSRSEQLAPDKPLVLYRRRFMHPSGPPGFSRTPLGPTEGLMIWIEPMGGPSVGR